MRSKARATSCSRCAAGWDRLKATRAKGRPVKAVRIHQRGEADALIVEEAPYPHLAENDVMVRVRPAGFAFTELRWPSTWTDRAGRDRTPTIPGHEVSGE